MWWQIVHLGVCQSTRSLTRLASKVVWITVMTLRQGDRHIGPTRRSTSAVSSVKEKGEVIPLCHPSSLGVAVRIRQQEVGTA